MGDWENEGSCIAASLDDPTCGNGTQLQSRACTDGEVDQCGGEDTHRTIKCKEAGTALPDCPKLLGDWQNEEPCISVGDNPSCGNGSQVQTRSCQDGTIDKCTDEDGLRTITCAEADTALPNCIKLLGDWVNDGMCIQVGDDPTCGDGSQGQLRNCKDGTVDKCTDEDTNRAVSCEEAGSALPDCLKIVGGWENTGSCIAVGDDPTCGHGTQLQSRTCKDGTRDQCRSGNNKRNIACKLAGTALPNCPRVSGRWRNKGVCKGIGFDPTCGDGNQVQMRTCKDGTVDKCTENNKRRIVTCKVAGTGLPKCRKLSIYVISNIFLI